MDYKDPFDKEPGKEPVNERARKHVFRFMKRSDDYRKPFLELASKADDLYRTWDHVAKTLTHRHNLQLPYAYQVIESETPQIVDAFLKEEPVYSIQGRTLNAMQYEGLMTDYHAAQLDSMRFQPKFVAFVKSCLKHGTAIAKVPYRFEEKEIIQRRFEVDPISGEQVLIKEPVLKVTYDGPDFENVPLEDFFPDWSSPNPGDIESMRGCAHRTWMTVEEIKAAGRYKNVSMVEHSINSKGCENAWSSPFWHEKWSGQDHKKERRKAVEIWEYWGEFDGREMLITIANGDVVIGMEENFYDYQFKPFIASVAVLAENEFYGYSELFSIQGLINEATKLRNARLDQINLAVNRMFIVDRAGGVNPQSLYARPSGIIFANDVNSVRPLDPPEVPASSYREVETINNEIQTTTASNSAPQLSAAGRTFGRSATGAQLVSSIASSRVGMKVKLMSELAIKPLARLIMLTNKQFVSEDQPVKMSDPAYFQMVTTLPVEAFAEDYFWNVVPITELDRSQTLNNMQVFQQLAQVAEATQPGVINWGPVFQEAGRALFGNRIQKFTRSDEERLALQQQSQFNEQAANAMVGAAAPQPNGNGAV